MHLLWNQKLHPQHTPQGTADHMEHPGKPWCIGKEDWGMTLMPGWQSNTKPLKNTTSKKCFKKGRTSLGLDSVVRRRSFVVFSHSVMSNSLRPHGLQQTRLPCPSPSPGACSNHVHWAGDAIQLSHLLSFPFPPSSTYKPIIAGPSYLNDKIMLSPNIVMQFSEDPLRILLRRGLFQMHDTLPQMSIGTCLGCILLSSDTFQIWASGWK